MFFCPNFDHSPNPGSHGLKVSVFPHLEERLCLDRLAPVQLLHKHAWQSWPHLQILTSICHKL